MPEWIAVALAGMVGGVAHALVFFGQITMPRWYVDSNGRRHWMPGIVGTLLIGGVASLAFWGFYSHEVSWTGSANVRPVIGGLIVGVAGDRTLKAFANQFVLESERGSLQQSVDKLTRTMTMLLSEIQSSEGIESKTTNEGGRDDRED
jgi:hypothetical protein